jgi:hypothetical protein
MGSRDGGPEGAMANKKQATARQTGWWIAAFWLTGAALFVLELNTGLDYLQSRLATLMPDFLGYVPALGLVGWQLFEAAFWNFAQLEATFRFIPVATLPFVLVGLALAMKSKFDYQHQQFGIK